jgi:hypothetical protein
MEFKQGGKLTSTEYWYKWDERLELVKGRIYLGIKLESLGNGKDRIIGIKGKDKRTVTAMINV